MPPEYRRRRLRAGFPEPDEVPANPVEKQASERACKPGFVPASSKRPDAGDGHFSRTPVARRLEQPTRTPNRDGPPRALPSLHGSSDETQCVLLGLAPGGVCRASRVAPAAGALLPHRFTLTADARKDGGSRASGGGLLSVALSRALRPVAVSDHPVLWSPDFPLALASQRSPDRLRG